MIPWRLPEGGKGKWMSLREAGIGFGCLPDIPMKLLTERPEETSFWLEGPHPAKNFAAKVTSHSYRRNLTCFLVQIKVRGATHIHTSVGQVHHPLGVVREAR